MRGDCLRFPEKQCRRRFSGPVTLFQSYVEGRGVSAGTEALNVALPVSACGTAGRLERDPELVAQAFSLHPSEFLCRESRRKQGHHFREPVLALELEQAIHQMFEIGL